MSVRRDLQNLRAEFLAALGALGGRMDDRFDALHRRIDTLVDSIANLRTDLAQHRHDD